MNNIRDNIHKIVVRYVGDVLTLSELREMSKDIYNLTKDEDVLYYAKPKTAIPNLTEKYSYINYDTCTKEFILTTKSDITPFRTQFTKLGWKRKGITEENAVFERVE